MHMNHLGCCENASSGGVGLGWSLIPGVSSEIRLASAAHLGAYFEEQGSERRNVFITS